MSAVYQPPLPSKKTEISQHESVSSLISSASLTATRTKAGQTIPPTSDLQRAFVARKDELLNSIITSRTLIQDLKGASSRGFVVQYPLRPKGAHDEPPVSSETFRATLPAVDSGLTPETDEACGLGAQSHALPDADLPDIPELRVLGIDVKTNGKSSSSLIGSLEASSVANLLQEKLAEATGYLDRLFKRVSDTSSKVFVTGDLNAGKSTFVNALLRREVVPQDQQPCTTHFCEVVDANQNDGREEVHAIRDPERYDRMDSTTFDRYDIRHLPMMVTENAEKNDYNLFKVYCNDQRPAAESLIKNGLVDISLIDSPGLNIDSLKTTANFAKQEDIDVVVFMVHAENQFTLSVRITCVGSMFRRLMVFISA